MYFDDLTITDQLSHNRINCLLQDRHGYLWIGTQYGLNKYDGYRVEHYGQHTSEPFRSGFWGCSITAMLEDRQGHLWVAAEKEGLSVRLRDQDAFVSLRDEAAFAAIRGHEIATIYEDRSGHIWLATVGRGVLRYDPATRSSRCYDARNSGLSNDLAFDIVEDSQGVVWVATAGPGLNLLQPDGRFGPLPTLAADPQALAGYRKTLLLEGDQLWVGVQGSGLYRVHTQTWQWEHVAYASGPLPLASDAVMDLCRTRQGALLIATDGGGLHVYDEEQGRMQVYGYDPNHPQGLSSQALICLWEDAASNIWIGTYNSGVNVYKASRTTFELFDPSAWWHQGLSQSSVLSMVQSRSGALWVGTDGGGLFQLDAARGALAGKVVRHVPGQPHTLPSDVITALYEDRAGRLWAGTYSAGLGRYDPALGGFRSYRYQYWNPRSLSGDNVWSIAEDRQGQLWIGTLGGGVSVWHPATDDFAVLTHRPGDPCSLPDANVMVVYADAQGRMWVGTLNQGLALWQEADSCFHTFRHRPGDAHAISDNEIRAIFEDSGGQLWIGTEGGGLNQWLGDGRFGHIGTEQGLIANSVMGITEDTAGYLWVSTFEGISRIAPDRKQIQNFDFRGGSGVNQFNPSAVLRTREGRLLFGGIEGIHAIRPETIHPTDRPARLVLSGFSIFDRTITAGVQEDGRTILAAPIETADRAWLDYTDRAFSIEFTLIDYTGAQPDSCTYRMEGLDKQWQRPLSGQHRATYAHLDPGTYTFWVRYRDQERRLTVVIAPPFWQTGWFSALMVLFGLGLLAAGIGWLIYRRDALHRRSLLEAQREILQLKNEKLTVEIGAKNSKLMSSAVQMAHKNELLIQIRQEVETLTPPTGQDRRRLLHLLDTALKDEDYWQQFNLYFDEVDKHFLQWIQQQHPSLTQNDLRICALIRLNLTNKEIASLLNISVRGIEQSRYRLKKRLGLLPEQSLSQYLARVSPDTAPGTSGL
ncbi:MAG: hypothetical protein OHK0039_13040 [Bacteroidia bacterium]